MLGALYNRVYLHYHYQRESVVRKSCDFPSESLVRRVTSHAPIIPWFSKVSLTYFDPFFVFLVRVFLFDLGVLLEDDVLGVAVDADVDDSPSILFLLPGDGDAETDGSTLLLLELLLVSFLKLLHWTNVLRILSNSILRGSFFFFPLISPFNR